MVYVLMLDEMDAPRILARKRLDEILRRPLDPEEAEEYDRELWLHSDEAMEAARQTEMMLDEMEGGGM